MSIYQECYIVQDLESQEFLYPDPSGDVGQTPYIKHAGVFHYVEDAIEAGEDLGVSFTLFKFYQPVD